MASQNFQIVNLEDLQEEQNRIDASEKEKEKEQVQRWIEEEKVFAKQQAWDQMRPAERFLREQLTKAVSLQDAFGSSESIGDRVSSFDFSSIIESNTLGFHTGLAPAYGTLTTAGSFQKMDDNLKIVMGSSLRSICSVPADQRSYMSIVNAFLSNPLLECVLDGCGGRGDSFRKSGQTAFKDGGIDQGIVNEVKSWFIKLIGDEAVLKDTKIDINVLGQLVAQTGACVTSFETLFHAEAHRRKTVIDIGVMRFPDIDRPFIKVYSIKLEAWSDSVRDLFFESDASGIEGDYKFMKFAPKAATMDFLAAEVHDQAVEDADDIFT